MPLLEWLWRLLPDRCQMHHCSRKGVRGNENVVYGVRMCDDCHAKMMKFVDANTKLPSSSG